MFLAYLNFHLIVVKGAESWEDLRRFQGVLHPTFKAACLARGLLEDDGEWKKCLQEAGDMHTGHQLRTLFVTLLLHCHPSLPHVLWNQFRVKICDDLSHRLTARGRINPTDDDVFDYGLHLIETALMQAGKSLRQYPDMPLPQQVWDNVVPNPLLQEQLAYDHDEVTNLVAQNYPRFNPQQKLAFDTVVDSARNNKGNLFFLHSAGGCGKTYVSNTIAAAIRADGDVALCVASSAIAALLLHGGRTAHSRFKIPIPIDNASMCNIKKDDNLHLLLKRTKLIIWDEAPMQHRYGPEALDRTLRDLFRLEGQDVQDVPLFGGITVMFVGDFRQTLPVVPRGSRVQIVNASLCKSRLWRHVQVLHLTTNMRLDRTPESEAFAQWLLKVGAGHDLPLDKTIPLRPNMRLPQNTIEQLINTIYPGIIHGNMSDQFFLERTILSSKNDTVDELNQLILDMFPGQESIHMSVDKVNSDNSHVYPVEFLNSLNTSGLPLARLALKPGCPLMLLRNLDPTNGLCNGTRMVLLEVRTMVLKCRILGGDHAGKVVFIPRLTLDPSSEGLPIELSRRQFPVRLAFVMTINKAQGQSIVNVGIDLRIPVFTHGQLYVALSRCTSSNRIKVVFPMDSENTSTTNVVYIEVLSGMINH